MFPAPSRANRLAIPSVKIRRIVAICLFSCAAALVARSQEANAPTQASGAASSTPSAARSSRWLHLTPDSIAYYRAIAVARQQQREAYIRASGDDDVITLAPYIVESDGSLVLARLRRELEMGGRSRASRFAEIAARPDPHLRSTSKAENAFFGGSGDPTGLFRIRDRSVGAPADAPAMGLFNPLGLSKAFRDRNVISSLFAAPTDAQP
jgi:hypothetical protein